jgi:hypothetical protein
MASVLRVDEHEIVARMAIAGMIGDRSAEEDQMYRLASPPPRISTRRRHHNAESTAAREAEKKAKKSCEQQSQTENPERGEASSKVGGSSCEETPNIYMPGKS